MPVAYICLYVCRISSISIEISFPFPVGAVVIISHHFLVFISVVFNLQEDGDR